MPPRSRRTPRELRAEAKRMAAESTNQEAPKVFQTFPSLQAMMTYAEQQEPGDLPGEERSSRKRAEVGFNDFPTWEAAVTAGRRGWPEGTDKIRTLSAVLTDKVLAQMRIPELTSHDEGLVLDVERYREGDPECLLRWEDSDDIMEGQGDVRILVNVCVSSMVSSEVLQGRGAAVVALVQALELAGKRVELTIAANVSDKIETQFIAKPMGEPLQLDQLAFSVASADMFRRFMFACWERAPKAVRDAVGVYQFGSYGMPKNAHHTNGAQLILPTMIGYGARNEFLTPERTEQWVLDKLEELGVQVERNNEPTA